jgi:dissimilatory sulfite reductase (desulfoviridin) alpha/beta subunit
MQPYAITAICSLLAAVGSGLVLFLVSQSSKGRDRRLESIEEVLNRLTDKIGVQNGRVGKLEEWKDMREKIHPSHVMLERQDEPKPPPRRRRK